jgi:hypothetical protein
MKAIVKMFIVAAVLAALAACSGAPVYQPSATPPGGYDFSAGDLASPYPPYHRPSHD